jgi:hypothetical protein
VSHQATTWVMEFSESKLATRLVLLAIAHRVSNDNGEAFPSVATIAREANVSESSVHASLLALVEKGELEIDREASQYGTNVYKLPKFLVWIEGLHQQGGTKSVPTKSVPPKRSKPSANSAPEPSVNHHKKTITGKTSTPSASGDVRHRVFVQFAREDFQTRHSGQKPTWNGKDFRQLREFLERNPDVDLAELKRRWAHFVSSLQPFIRNQGESLGFFCSNFDRFIDGPLFAAPVSGGTNGKTKPTHGDAFASAGKALARAVRAG